MTIKSKKGITLVLGGGGARGLAHIGVLEVLEENKIPIKRIIGTSAGALVGGFYCAGMLDLLKKKFEKFDIWELLKFSFSSEIKHSILNTDKLDSLLGEAIKGIKIEKFKIPFTAVSYDLKKDKKTLIDKGDLFSAIRSSMSIPGLFMPFKTESSLFIDGALVDIVPVDIAKKIIGKKSKDIIVAVNVDAHLEVNKNRGDIFHVIPSAFVAQLRELSILQEKGADLSIHPDINIKDLEFTKAKKAIRAGRIAAEKSLVKIKELLRK